MLLRVILIVEKYKPVEVTSDEDIDKIERQICEDLLQ